MYAIVKPTHTERNWLRDVEVIETWVWLKDAKKRWVEILSVEKESTPYYTRVVKVTRSGEFIALTSSQNEYLIRSDEIDTAKVETLAWDMASEIEKRDYFNDETKQLGAKPKGRAQ